MFKFALGRWDSRLKKRGRVEDICSLVDTRWVRIDGGKMRVIATTFLTVPYAFVVPNKTRYGTISSRKLPRPNKKPVIAASHRR